MQSGTLDKIILINDKEEGEIIEQKMSEDVQQSSFKFLDLFWFLNLEPSSENGLTELELVTINLNINFGNIRLNGYQFARKYIYNNALFLPKDALTVNAAIYPTAIFNILNLQNLETYSPIEQLYTEYCPELNPWQNELTNTLFQKSNDRIRVVFETSKKEKYFYIFKDKQLNMFNHALTYVISQGFTLVGQNKVHK